MITSKQVCKGVLFALCIAGLLPRTSDGFNGDTHSLLSRRAVDPTLLNASQLDGYLRSLWLEFDGVVPDSTGFIYPIGWNGIGQAISGGKTVVELIADGSVQEDSPSPRVQNHFHDPTRTWNSAGWKLGPFAPYLSSILWSQLTAAQPDGETRTWKTARDAFFNALTSTSPSQRKQQYAETFRTLGHLIHHVQDAAVPAHTRNDTHFAPSERSAFPLGDRFHFWAEANLGVIDESISVAQGGYVVLIRPCCCKPVPILWRRCPSPESLTKPIMILASCRQTLTSVSLSTRTRTSSAIPPYNRQHISIQDFPSCK